MSHEADAFGSPGAAVPVDAPVGELPRRSKILSVLVAIFVVVHLGMLVTRITIELIDKPFRAWLERKQLWGVWGPTYKAASRITKAYVHFLGVEQNWLMFAAPMARGVCFLAARVELDDGEIIELASPNFVQARSYLRFGGWRQRKLEDSMVHATPKELETEPEIAVWSAYVRWSVRRWREDHPDDSRSPVRVTLWKIRYALPEPGEPLDFEAEPTERLVGTFNPDGTLR
jgi:hypothetical protein